MSREKSKKGIILDAIDEFLNQKFECTELLGSKEKKLYHKVLSCSSLNFRNKRIYKIQNMEYFLSLKSLDLSNNVLVEFPDLSRFQNLEIFDISNNPIKSIVKIDWFPVHLKEINFVGCLFDNYKIISKELKFSRRYLEKLNGRDVNRKKYDEMLFVNEHEEKDNSNSSLNISLTEKEKILLSKIIIKIKERKLENTDSYELYVGEAKQSLKKVIKSLRKYVTLGGDPKDEQFNVINTDNIYDKKYYFYGDNEINCFLLDAFLYSEKDMKKMFKNGTIIEYYCRNCLNLSFKKNSKCKKCKKRKVIEKRDHITNSLAVEELEQALDMIDELGFDFKNKTLVDIGSRLGNVLFFFYYFTDIKKVVGIEIEKRFVDIAKKIVKNFVLDEQRIQIIHDNFKNKLKTLKSADIIVFFNPFTECNPNDQKEYLQILKENTKNGALIISSPSIKEIYEFSKIPFNNWVKMVDKNEEEEVFIYKVIKKIKNS